MMQWEKKKVAEEIAKAKRETAKEILQKFKDTFIVFNPRDAISIDLIITRLEYITKQYDVEVE